ncbi:MAG: tRNA threonylcarbamoyladenosine biosynthesis protein [Clostridia bacterium BRH_c25]|nr:MAG: tRNA threonylcarbamoyladenosine biosynthesis protein [Clostridia bacterium BRH_c25]
MDTEVFFLDERSIDSDIIDRAAEIIRSNGTVIFPTETVYGLGANALSGEAVKGIFAAKGRPSDNPLIVHISSMNMLLYLIGSPLSEAAKLLIEKYWPGPLTLIFKKSGKVPYEVTAGLNTVAVRMPDNRIALELINRSELPIAAPSANISGKPSPTLPEHAIDDMQGRVDMILCGSKSRIGVESTVLDLSGDIPVVLRPGGVTVEELESILGSVGLDRGSIGGSGVPKAPGMKYTHYAPEADMIIVKGELESIKKKIQELAGENAGKGLKVGVLASDETESYYENCRVLSLGSRTKADVIASNVFEKLREFDKMGVDIIFAEALDEKHMGMAVMNRMNKAAGFNIIEV